MFVLSRMLNGNFKYWKRDDLIQVHVSQNHVHSILFFGAIGFKERLQLALEIWYHGRNEKGA